MMKALKNKFLPSSSFIPGAVVQNLALVSPKPKRARSLGGIRRQRTYANQQLTRGKSVRDIDAELIGTWVQRKAPHLRRSAWLLAKQFQLFVAKPLAQVTLADVWAFATLNASRPIESHHSVQALLGVKSLLTFGYRVGALPVNIPDRQWPKFRPKRHAERKKSRRFFGLGLGLGACMLGLALIMPGWLWKKQSTQKVEDWKDPMMSAQILEIYAETEAALKSANIKAFLDTIAWAEGTAGEDGYRIQYTGEKFASYETHPDRVNCANSYGQPLCSSAAGRYQFLKPTYDRLQVKLGLPDFSPRSQDLAAVELIREQGALDDIENGNIKAALEKVSAIWVHIEGAGYGQPEYPFDKLEEVYWKERKKYR